MKEAARAEEHLGGEKCGQSNETVREAGAKKKERQGVESLGKESRGGGAIMIIICLPMDFLGSTF